MSGLEIDRADEPVEDKDSVAGSTDPALVAALYTARRDRVDFVDVPDLGYAAVDGRGAPGGPGFTDAVQALLAVSREAHLAVVKASGQAPTVMPLEALWWIEGPDAAGLVERLTMGGAAPNEGDQACWHWRAMMVQPPPIGEAAFARAVEAVRTRQSFAALDAMTFAHWTEGSSAQILHVGPYRDEQRDITALHQALAEHGCRPRGRHHEIYLSDPSTSAPEKLRTILRHPYSPAA